MVFKEFAKKIRTHALCMVSRAKASHIGSCLSMADVLAVLYCEVLNVEPSNPNWAERDRFILSKGHGAAVYYAALAERGFFSKKWLDTYCEEGSKLVGHVTFNNIPGIEVSTGSLGHGLSIGCGMAIAAKRDKKSYRIFAMLSDGELDEGSNWEAILFASHHNLDNLITIVDYNKIQAMGNIKEILNLEPLKDKFVAFGWAVKEINGHNFEQISSALKTLPFKKNKPSVIIAHTIKGKGVSFMENQFAWHYKSPDKKQLLEALKEIEESG